VQNFSIGIVYFSKQIASQLKSESMATQHGAIVALEKWTKYSNTTVILWFSAQVD
jgi:hypothetical protein